MTPETVEKMFHFGWDMFSGEMIISLLTMLIIVILSFVIYFKFKKADPLKPEKGFIMVIVFMVEKLEAFVKDLMGKKWINFSGYLLGLAAYMMVCFVLSVTGLPSPFTYFGVTLSIALCTFGLIHFTAMKANKLAYFKRYTDPFAILLPINLLSMWSPLLSLSLRLFGNALAGFTLMSIIYYALGGVSDIIFGWLIPGGASSIFIAPFITPILHAYFDLFSGVIQTLIFCMLTMIFVSQEDPDEEEEQQIQINN